jgi:hypothetical protein
LNDIATSQQRRGRAHEKADREAVDPGTAESTCMSWTSASAALSANAALLNTIGGNLGFFSGVVPCNFGPHRVYCLQE